MPASPKVSIIMGVYNCENTLHEAIDSILNQTFQDWEFIICDDCSTDGTYQILEEYKQQYPNKFIILSNSQNSHLAASLNHCLQYASGEYIARMDGDDLSVPCRLEKLSSFLDAHQEYQVVGSQMIMFDEKGDIGVKEIQEFPDKYTMRKKTPFTHATIMMRKYAYDALNGYCVCTETRRCEDAELWFRFFEKGFSGCNLQEPLYKVREDQKAFRRRQLRYGIDLLKICWKGFRMLNYPFYYYIYIIKPLISSIMPAFIMKTYHELRARSVGRKNL